MMPSCYIAAEDIERARAMRERGVPWVKIAYELGLKSEHYLRKQIEPGYIERQRNYARKHRHPSSPSLNAVHNARIYVPDDVVVERNQAFALGVRRTIVQELCGDPLPGRSALDKKT